MKLRIAIITLFVSLTYFGQAQIELQSMDQLNTKGDYGKIILITADWCNICRSNKEIILQSEELSAITKDKISFYEFPQYYDAEVEFSGKTYLPDPSHQLLGGHELLNEFFSMDDNEEFYPTFIIIDNAQNIIGTYQGLLNESDLLMVSRIILNQTASPDSDRNN